MRWILIAAADQNNGIGKDGRLLYDLPSDRRYFRSLTMGKTIVIGRKTLLSFPGGKPLPARKNIVLSRDPGFIRDGCTVVHSRTECLACLKDTEEVWVCGGAEIYRLFFSEADEIYLTRIDADKDADAFFPRIDEAFEKTAESPSAEENGTVFRHVIYRKRVRR